MHTRTHIRPQEIAAVIELPAADRYAHTVKQSADWGALWSLRTDTGWVTVEDEDGHPALAVWPHRQYAELCAADKWSGTTAAAIEIHEAVDELLPKLGKEGTKVAVFPTPSGKVVLVAPGQLERDLGEELSKIE